jgi:hypothetical protein
MFEACIASYWVFYEEPGTAGGTCENFLANREGFEARCDEAIRWDHEPVAGEEQSAVRCCCKQDW